VAGSRKVGGAIGRPSYTTVKPGYLEYGDILNFSLNLYPKEEKFIQIYIII
jgi:hypothetical protein